MTTNQSRVGQKFRILNLDGDTEAYGVGEELECIQYDVEGGKGWPIVAISDLHGLEIGMSESEVEWL